MTPSTHSTSANVRYTDHIKTWSRFGFPPPAARCWVCHLNADNRR